MAAQLREPRVPVDDLAALDALAPSDRRLEVVVDALARNAAHPSERADVSLQKRLDRHIEREVRRRRPRERQREHQRIDAALSAGDPWPRRHLAPIDLQHLPRPITRPLRRPLASRPQRREPLANKIDRARIAVLLAQDLRHPRRLDVLEVRDQIAQHRLQRIEHRARRRPRIARRLGRRDQPRRRPPVDPQPPRDLARRDPVRGHRLDLRPLQRAAHLPVASRSVVANGLETPDETGDNSRVCTFRFLEAAHYWAPGVKSSGDELTVPIHRKGATHAASAACSDRGRSTHAAIWLSCANRR